MKLFLAIFAATVVLGPALAVLFYLCAFALGDLPDLFTWIALLVGNDGVGRPQPELTTPGLVREHGRLLLTMAYVLGGLPAAVGGAFLGWRFTRTPPRLGLAAPLALGVVLGLLLIPIIAGMRLTLSFLISTANVLAISLACAACCWAIARLIHWAMAPKAG